MKIEPGKEYTVKREGDNEYNFIDVWIAASVIDPTTKLVCINITDRSELAGHECVDQAGIDLDIEQAIELRDLLIAAVEYVQANPPKCFRCGHERHCGACVNIAPSPCEGVEL